MRLNKRSYIEGYLASLVLAMGLSILPLPVFLKVVNPDWVLLVLIYWVLRMPEKVGVFNAWLVGLLVDVLTGRLFGIHALAYAIVCFFYLKIHKRLRQYPLPQQTLFVFCGLLFSQIMLYWIETLQGKVGISLIFWLPVLTSALFWPVINIGLRYFRISGHIN
ncbi:MAG: rod shape-determining protein MreD [Methylococcales bacterium]|nr:rod shape-determining protein MreD [Methylococcales bacterium]